MPTTVEQIPGKTWPVASGKEMLSPTISTTVTLTPPKGASFALMQPLGADVRWWDDGSTPTVSQGFVMVSGALYTYAGDLKTFRAIAASGTPTLSVNYYRSSPTEIQGQ